MSTPPSPFLHLVSACLRDPARVRFTFIDEMGVNQFLNGKTLVERSLALGAGLMRYTSVGDRVLLPYPAGLDFLVGFLGCIASGRIPVPANYPKPHRPLSRFNSIADDCTATLAITTHHTLRTLDLTQKSPMPWMASEQIEAEGQGQLTLDTATAVAPDEVLFLQYTSGSTSTPKGVVIKSHNLFANLKTISHGFGLELLPREDRIVSSWLPAYHDMGLVGVLMSTLIHDGHAVMMSPATFLRRPMVWLRSIEQYRASITVSPTFGYQWAANRVSASEAGKLNLKSLRLAACGAEPIQATVLENFSAHFAGAGFRHSAFYPCYGLAEATLLVSGDHRGATQQTDSPSKAQSNRTPHRLSNQFDRHLLTQHIASESNDSVHSVDIVNCGRPGLDVEIAIASLDTRKRLDEGQIGEIVIRSPGVAAGYWGKLDENADGFRFQFPGENLDYLQTGDLGFLWKEDLYVTGRQKDLIIVAGQNYYPHDIEFTASHAHPTLSGCPGAAFSVPGEATEQLVIVQELPRGIESDLSDSILRQIRVAVASVHEIAASAVILLRSAGIPRTSSGKIQRNQTREDYLLGKLNHVAQWQLSTDLDRTIFKDLTHLRTSSQAERLKHRIMDCLSLWVAANTGESLDRLQPEQSFAELGIDSLKAVQMAQEIEQWLKVPVSPVVAWSYPTCQALAEHLTKLSLNDQPRAETEQEPQDSDDLMSLLDEIEALDDQAVDQICASRRPIN